MGDFLWGLFMPFSVQILWFVIFWSQLYYRIETEGHVLHGSEVKVYTDDDDIKQELKKGEKDNVWAIHEILSEKMLNDPQKEIGEVEIDLTAEY